MGSTADNLLDVGQRFNSHGFLDTVSLLLAELSLDTTTPSEGYATRRDCC